MLSVFNMKLSPQNIICLDVEFTDPRRPELLSVGLASASGAGHYAELDFQHPANAGLLARCSDFTRHGGVLEQWGRVPGSAGTLEVLARRTADWLFDEARRIHAQASQPAFIVFDHPTDFELLVRLLQQDARWPQLAPQLQALDVSELTSRFDAAVAEDAAFEELRRQRGLARHHALADALALRAALYAGLTGRRIPL